MKKSIKKTLKKDLCVNCGICKVVCPNNAIKMKRNIFGELNPKIDKKKCTNCGICLNFCPNSKEKIKEKISLVNNLHTFGLENAKYYVAYSKDKIQRQKSCSGGVTTELASYLLNNKLINGMIHTERIWSKKGELHYRARISKTQEEIRENVSSSYQPIDFSSVLEQLKEDEIYLITGTPCVISGFKKLFSEHKKFKKIKIITCALICSHNTNSQFIDYFSQMHKIKNNEPWKVNIRQKDDEIKDANNFNNHFYSKNKTLLKKNRFESGWTNIWRNYYFALNCCLYCPDFWGMDADISIKDAWGIWSDDPLGKSIAVIRNEKIEKYFLNSNIEFEELDYETMKEHQKPTPIFKQTEAKNKFYRSFIVKENRKNGLMKYKIISYFSKRLYRLFGFEIASKIMKLIEKICENLEKI